jgi:hypothetical protein
VDEEHVGGTILEIKTGQRKKALSGAKESGALFNGILTTTDAVVDLEVKSLADVHAEWFLLTDIMARVRFEFLLREQTPLREFFTWRDQFCFPNDLLSTLFGNAFHTSFGYGDLTSRNHRNIERYEEASGRDIRDFSDPLQSKQGSEDTRSAAVTQSVDLFLEMLGNGAIDRVYMQCPGTISGLFDYGLRLERALPDEFFYFSLLNRITGMKLQRSQEEKRPISTRFENTELKKVIQRLMRLGIDIQTNGLKTAFSQCSQNIIPGYFKYLLYSGKLPPIQVLRASGIDIQKAIEIGDLNDDRRAFEVLSRSDFAKLAFLYPRADQLLTRSI